MITADIILDSISPANKRLTTWVLTYPRFIHAEVMTHRVFSRNASSSRAIPIAKMLEAVKTNPAGPVFWGKNQSGMQANGEIDDTISSFYRRKDWVDADGFIKTARLFNVTARKAAELDWLDARDGAITSAKKMIEVGLHKQIANRLLEPWMHITVILSGTEYENFFSLRAHEDAQPEFQALANLMLEKYNASTPQSLNWNQWHIPFGDGLDTKRILSLECAPLQQRAFAPDATEEIINSHLLLERKLAIATARCARVSYLNFEGKDDYEADIELAGHLSASGHWSPFEHCAKASLIASPSNFDGWMQYRKQFPTENRTDSRIVKKTWTEPNSK